MNILITRHDKIGDFITALPMCKVLKQQTNHKIIMLVSKINEDLAKKLDFIDEVIVYSSDKNILSQKIKAYNIDVSISAYIDFNLGLSLFLAKVPIRIGPKTKVAQIFFNKSIRQKRSLVKKTEWEYNLDLLKVFDKDIKMIFNRPLLEMKNDSKKPFAIFHTGSGGSNDGNFKLKDYLRLAKTLHKKIDIVFTFGPDDKELQKKVEKSFDFPVIIRDDFHSLWEFTTCIAESKLFISTSTGPMHLAGLVNTQTISFFGQRLFASSKRWATISDKEMQNNFEIPINYDEKFYEKVEKRALEIL